MIAKIINVLPVTAFRIGVADAYTGVDHPTLSVTATVAIESRVPGAQLADLAANIGDGIYAITLPQPLSKFVNAVLTVQVADKQGNVTQGGKASIPSEVGGSLPYDIYSGLVS